VYVSLGGTLPECCDNQFPGNGPLADRRDPPSSAPRSGITEWIAFA